jgi:hypothetical protein
VPRVPIVIRLGVVKLNNIEHMGSVVLGSACRLNRNVAGKKNQGFGQQHADGVRRERNVHWTQDDEPADAASRKINR